MLEDKWNRRSQLCKRYETFVLVFVYNFDLILCSLNSRHMRVLVFVCVCVCIYERAEGPKNSIGCISHWHYYSLSCCSITAAYVRTRMCLRLCAFFDGSFCTDILNRKERKKNPRSIYKIYNIAKCLLNHSYIHTQLQSKPRCLYYMHIYIYM